MFEVSFSYIAYSKQFYLKIFCSGKLIKKISLERLSTICYIDTRKGEATEAAYPHILYNLHLYDVSRQLVPVVGGYFRLSLKIS